MSESTLAIVMESTLILAISGFFDWIGDETRSPLRVWGFSFNLEMMSATG